jgi:hypothetical protein
MKRISILAAGLGVASMIASVSAAELTANGGFETGDTSGWVSFPTAGSTFNITNDASAGLFAAELFNPTGTSGAVVKQANVGVGIVNPGEQVFISFDAKGSSAEGGVAFAEFFSEIAGGGVSAAGILGGGPLALTNAYQSFNFTAIAGPDVSGGVTLQFAAVTGAAPGSVIVLFIDNVSVRSIPEPATLATLAFGSLALLRRR